jgi:hypothetical protein
LWHRVCLEGDPHHWAGQNAEAKSVPIA